MPKSILTLVAGLIGVMALTACDNTIRGVGRDARETADAVEDVAD